MEQRPWKRTTDKNDSEKVGLPNFKDRKELRAKMGLRMKDKSVIFLGWDLSI